VAAREIDRPRRQIAKVYCQDLLGRASSTFSPPSDPASPQGSMSGTDVMAYKLVNSKGTKPSIAVAKEIDSNKSRWKSSTTVITELAADIGKFQSNCQTAAATLACSGGCQGAPSRS